MPQAEPRKQGHHWLLLPWAVVIVTAIAWSVWWFHGQGVIRQVLASQQSQLKGRGVTLAWKSETVTGFPFRYDVTLGGFSAAQANGPSLAVDKLELEANAYDPTHWVGDTPGPLHIDTGKGDLTVTGAVLRFSVSHPSQPIPRLYIEGQKLQLTGWGPFSAIDRFEVHVTDKDANTGDFFLRIDKATPQGQSLLARMASAEGVIVGLEGEFTKPAALRGPGLKGALINWADAGGAFNIQRGGIEAGEAELSLKPTTLYLGPDGVVNGDLGLSLQRASDAVLAMGAVGALPSQTAAVGSGIASVGQAFGVGKDKAVSVTLKFRNGVTTLGGVPIGPAPHLFQP